jgi:hypothetical protein
MINLVISRSVSWDAADSRIVDRSQVPICLPSSKSYDLLEPANKDVMRHILNPFCARLWTSLGKDAQSHIDLIAGKFTTFLL